jgi:hypothetical protein
MQILKEKIVRYETDGSIVKGYDAGELIRCKDCKYKNKYSYCTMYLNFHHLTADMDYCSDAERKEE